MRSTAPTEVGELAAGAIREILARATAGRSVGEYVDTESIPWRTFEEGGWDRIGASEAAGGGDATLRDLAEVAMVWGASCVPLPLLESTVVRRWSAAGRDESGPLTVSVAAAGVTPGAGLAPFAALDGVRVARSLGTDGDEFESSSSATDEPFAHGLRCAVLPWVTELCGDARVELEVVWAAEAVGAAQRLLDLAVAYAKERVQFDRPIGSFQAVKHRLSDMHIETQLAETAVLWASLEPDQAHRPVRFALDAAIGVAQDAIQVHGAMGFTWELGLHYYLRSMLVRREMVTRTGARTGAAIA
jgi:alkylation response protein AidB-like acyl-CoA dehydrogenase